MKTILLTLIASIIGILSLAADQSSPAFPVPNTGTLIGSEVLPSLPPGWQIIALEPVPPVPPNIYRRERIF